MLTTLVLAWPAAAPAQGTAAFSGSWKLEKSEPPVDAGGRGAGGRGGGATTGGGPDSPFSTAPATISITQTPANVSVQYGSTKAVYTLDGKQTVTPAGDINALKTWAHWDGTRLHLHHKQAMSFGRDVLSVNGSALTVVRDLETGGGSTTRTLTYIKQM